MVNLTFGIDFGGGGGGARRFFVESTESRPDSALSISVPDATEEPALSDVYAYSDIGHWNDLPCNLFDPKKKH